MSSLYKTEVTVTGGREGKVHSQDGKLELSLSPPKELGGPAGSNGTNPEQLFAAGYAACFESAVRFVAGQKKIAIQSSSVTSEVSLSKRPEGGFKVGISLNVKLPGVDKKTAEELVNEAHQNICPYSHATRNNIDVNLKVVD